MSGGDAWFIEVARRLPAIRWVVVTSALGKEICEREHLVARYIVTSHERHFDHLPTTYITRTLRAIRLTRHLSPDVVLAMSDAPPDVLVAVCIKVRSRRKAMRYQQRIHHIVPRRRGRRAAWAVQAVMHLLVAASADVVVVNSNLLKESLRSRAVRARRVIISKPGVAHPGRVTTKAASNLPNALEGIHALYLGRLHRSKGVLELPAIWKTVMRYLPEARLVIAGQGPPDIVQQLRDGVSAAEVARNVSILGFIPANTAADLRQHARVFVSPSHEEGFGMVVLEALAAGLPVVAWDLAVYREHFSGGMKLVREGDIEAFAQSVVELIRNPQAQDHASCEALKCASEYNWDRTAAREYEDIFLKGC